MALPRLPRTLAALCGLLAALGAGAAAAQCPEHQYRFHQRCCSDCAPGQRMRSRCTAWADTVCSPCQDGYFSSRHHHGFCQSCTVCNARKGSVEVKPCERTSDRVCVCQAGFGPSRTPLGSECSRCPAGTFSRGRNEKCQPWTNCSSFGKSTLRAGTATEDSLCSLDPIPTEFPKTRAAFPTEFPKPRAAFPTEFPKTKAAFPLGFLENSSRASQDIPAVCLEPGSTTEPTWGSLSLLLLCLLLLLVSGISIVLLLIQASQKNPRNCPARSSQPQGGSCRIPIQEEQAECDRSLVKG